MDNKLKSTEQEALSQEDIESNILDRKLSKLMRQDLTNEQIMEILHWKDLFVVGRFLHEYDFEEEDLPIIHSFILNNLDHEDRLFVSDLIEVATELDLELPYLKCLEFLDWKAKADSDEDDQHYVVMATIDYVFKNLKQKYIARIVDSLNNILNNRNSYQSTQVRADFVLFRITQKQKYLWDMIDLVINEKHQGLLNNILKDEYNRQRYFEYHDFLKLICRPEKKQKKTLAD